MARLPFRRRASGSITGAATTEADPGVTSEISDAFDHPEARLGVAGNPPDRISLRDHVVEADIGAFQQERGQTQRLRFNIAVELRPHQGADTDDVDRILSYDKLTGAIAAELAAERLNLLETLADRVAARILAEPQALRVFLRIEKLDRGPGALGVEIVRSGAAPAPGGPATGAAAPRILFVPPDLADVGRLLSPGPVILALALPDLLRPAADGAAGLRIALLEIEQAAWALAAHEPRLTVVSTRTEIDWAIDQGNAIVWAPSKLVCDTPGAPGEVGNGLPLAVWLAEQLGAGELIVHAPVALPAESRIPLVRG